jgi:hypothetical protein
MAADIIEFSYGAYFHARRAAHFSFTLMTGRNLA